MYDIRFLLKTHYEESRALIVGINKYIHASPLSYAVNDAIDVKETLISKLEFPESNIVTLLDADATRENIYRSFMRFASEDIGLDDRLVVFYAGHGTTRSGVRGEVGYLVPVDGAANDPSTLLRWDDFTRNADLIRAKHVFFIMDACYGGLALTRGSQAGSARFLKDMLLRRSRQVLTAGKADEVVSDSGGPIPNHSVFTGHLIEGMGGKAASADGVITASGLMSYVYGKVATDGHSNQTPHYGHIDGDGDFVLFAPVLSELDSAANKDIDRLVVIPYLEVDESLDNVHAKIKRVKELLASQESSIQLHDFVVDEVKRFLAATGDDHFLVSGTYSSEELVSRITRYEDATKILSTILACLAYWASPSQQQTLKKAISRSLDRLEVASGLSVWIHLRWYPLLLQMYCAGIAALEAMRYDSLATIFMTSVVTPDRGEPSEYFVERASQVVLEFNRSNLFKQLPGHEKQYTPMSEYLFKLIQPQLDDALFLGKSYEAKFDEFEILFALVSADMRKQRGKGVWGNPGRFAWKHSSGGGSPFVSLVAQAKSEGNQWAPLRSGLFGGKLERFEAIADEYAKILDGLNWW